jgi:hypothetical protein
MPHCQPLETLFAQLREWIVVLGNEPVFVDQRSQPLGQEHNPIVPEHVDRLEVERECSVSDRATEYLMLRRNRAGNRQDA